MTNLFFRLGMHEGAAAPLYSIRSGGMYAARLEALWASKSASPTADGKIEDFDAAPSERPKWPLPLSFFFLAPTSASPGWGSGSAGPFGPSSNLQPRKRGLRLSPRAAFHLPGVPALRSAKALSSDLQPRKRGLRPTVTEGDRKMMQLEKMNISFFRRVLTLSTPRTIETHQSGSRLFFRRERGRFNLF